jgi:hypothetical protein
MRPIKRLNWTDAPFAATPHQGLSAPKSARQLEPDDFSSNGDAVPSFLFEHDSFGKPVPIPLSKCGAGFFRILL